MELRSMRERVSEPWAGIQEQLAAVSHQFLTPSGLSWQFLALPWVFSVMEAQLAPGCDCMHFYFPELLQT